MNGADPKLREMMRDIQEVFDKYDAAGYVILASQTHAEFKAFLYPTWSGFTKVNGSPNLKLKGKWSNPADRKLVEDTIQIALVLKRCSSYSYELAESFLEQLRKHFSIAESTPKIMHETEL